MARGILETIGLAGTVLLAAPVGLFGANLLFDGSPGQGAIFLVIAALMVLVPRYVRTPRDVASEGAEQFVGTVVKSDDSEE